MPINAIANGRTCDCLAVLNVSRLKSSAASNQPDRFDVHADSRQPSGELIRFGGRLSTDHQF